jgi:hypothetical protein
MIGFSCAAVSSRSGEEQLKESSGGDAAAMT